ncbi:ABC transporter [Planomonospora sphaerica]|uniref:ABC transporter n=1 Tax=Planomonospora sphaerica TaxID=161355 RepID=A0A161LIX7_9ACTN|nr:ABC transporter ATP-binding protein [Planomonospora sphaerica]GAT68764.1 ABC transporter [Planomonospora sphaerica]
MVDHTPARDEVVLEAQGLTKRYGEREAVRGIDFRVTRGEFVGFLGPNGAGKSSTMRMIASTSPRSGGQLRMFGLDPANAGARIRARIGVVPQNDNLDSELTVQQNLYVYGLLFGLPRRHVRARAAELLEFVQLTDRADAAVESLSGGMKRRLTIARALVNQPELMLLDEPTTGLDPQARHLVWERLYRLKAEGVTLVLTTHYMDEAEQLCDRLFIIDDGRVVASGSPAALIGEYCTREVLEVRVPEEERPRVVKAASKTAARVDELPDRVLIYANSGERALAALRGDGLEPLNTLVRRASLEDVFLRLTGRSLVD